MNNYYHRQIQLWGKEAQNLLSHKTVLIIGCGGLGNSISLCLSGVGLNEIILVDFDKVELHNIHRQVCFAINDQNKFKASLLSSKLATRNTQTKFTSHNISFQEYIKTNNTKVDLIIDATDSLQVRKKINKFAKENNTPWIYSSVEEFHGQVCFFHSSSFEYLNTIKNQPKGIAAPMVMQVASLSANLATRYLNKLPITKDILHYLYYDKSGEFNIKKFVLK